MRQGYRHEFLSWPKRSSHTKSPAPARSKHRRPQLGEVLAWQVVPVSPLERVVAGLVPALVYSFGTAVCSNSMRSNSAAPPIAVGAMPVRVNSPKSRHRSRVTTVHSRGAEGEISTDRQPAMFRPAW